MKLLTTSDGKEVWFTQIERPFHFESPFQGRRYVAIVFANDETVTRTERRFVTEALFNSGCRYGVFAGHECGAWESAMDATCIESDPNYEPSDEAFTPTTAHAGESVEEVVFFGLTCTANTFVEGEFDRFLILSTGPSVSLHAEIEAAVRSVWSLDTVA